jgi:hypothetical protein
LSRDVQRMSAPGQPDFTLSPAEAEAEARRNLIALSSAVAVNGTFVDLQAEGDQTVGSAP